MYLSSNAVGPMAPAGARLEQWWSVPALRYSFWHLMLLVASTLDLMVTWMILCRGGDEINPLAAVVWNSWSQWGDNPQAGLTGLSLYKFGIVTLVVILCEWVGRRKKKVGLRLSRFAVLLTLLVVLFAALQLAIWPG